MSAIKEAVAETELDRSRAEKLADTLSQPCRGCRQLRQRYAVPWIHYLLTVYADRTWKSKMDVSFEPLLLCSHVLKWHWVLTQLCESLQLTLYQSHYHIMCIRFDIEERTKVPAVVYLFIWYLEDKSTMWSRSCLARGYIITVNIGLLSRNSAIKLSCCEPAVMNKSYKTV